MRARLPLAHDHPYDDEGTCLTDWMGDMGALDDLTKKAQDFVEENKDKIEEVLNSEQAEDISDKVIDAVSDTAKKVVPDEHHGKVDDVAANIDKAVGTEP